MVLPDTYPIVTVAMSICVTWRHLVTLVLLPHFTFDLIPHLPGFADEALNALRQILQQRVDEFLKFVDPATALAPEGGWDTGTENVGSKSWWIFIQT